ncbi:hypothetical protein ERJ75_000638000 [Trypanosoma vivax]|nr:hypothetical protein ERJ75_000638000 [Trypanosoma vivax]
MGTRIFRKVEETWVGAGTFSCLLCFALPPFAWGRGGRQGNRQTNSKLVCAGSSALKGAAISFWTTRRRGLQKVWHMDLATTRGGAGEGANVHGYGETRNIVKAVSSRIKARREKVALARNKSEEAMQAAREFAKFAYVAGGIDAFMLTLATYSAGAHSGSHNARCLNNDAAGTSAEKYQAGDGVEKARLKSTPCSPSSQNAGTRNQQTRQSRQPKQPSSKQASSHRLTARKR